MTGQRVSAGDKATPRGGAIVRVVHTWVTPHPVALLAGNAGSDETRVLAAGSEPWASFVAEDAFDGTPSRRPLANRPAWLLPPILDYLPTEADLVTERVDRLTARWLLRQPHLTVQLLARRPLSPGAVEDARQLCQQVLEEAMQVDIEIVTAFSDSMAGLNSLVSMLGDWHKVAQAAAQEGNA